MIAYTLGLPELLVLLAIALLLFSSRLPGVMRSLGQGIVEFRKGLQQSEKGQSSADVENRPKSSGD